MKKLLSFLVIALLGFGGMQLSARPDVALMAQESPAGPIHPRVLNLLVKGAADAWNITVGQAHQDYASGRLLFEAHPEIAPGTYMMLRDGGCILIVVLEGW